MINETLLGDFVLVSGWKSSQFHTQSLIEQNVGVYVHVYIYVYIGGGGGVTIKS